jgi:hypothetical protein
MLTFSEQDPEVGFDMSHSTVKSLRSTDTGGVKTVSPLHHKILLHQACKKTSKLSETITYTHIYGFQREQSNSEDTMTLI